MNHHISAQENQVADYISKYLCEHYDGIEYAMFRSIAFRKVYEMLHINTNNVLSDGLQEHLFKELDVYIP